ncbi:MAG: hypothetical protein K2X66_04445, partial [Cyanobacteria bacterium]|nr:hypothetical protein [Cyanobacteriota bacterium]
MSTRLNQNILKAYCVPGLPHLVYSRPEWGQKPWQDLKKAFASVAQQAQELEPEVLVIYSSQWISVLGHSYQACPNPVGYHVDENWYDLGDFPFSFPVDLNLTQRAEAFTQKEGFATKLVNYEGFPIDTGTLVTLKYFNPDNKIPVVIVSSNIYCSQEDSYRLGQAMGKAILDSGKQAVIINCSSLSHR